MIFSYLPSQFTDFSLFSEKRISFVQLISNYLLNFISLSQVKVLFLILVDLCRRTSTLPHPLAASQVGSNNIIIRLHYIDGNYTVLPEVVEASLGPHMQVLVEIFMEVYISCICILFMWAYFELPLYVSDGSIN